MDERLEVKGVDIGHLLIEVRQFFQVTWLSIHTWQQRKKGEQVVGGK